MNTLLYFWHDLRIHKWRRKCRSSHIGTVSHLPWSHSADDVTIDCWWRHNRQDPGLKLFFGAQQQKYSKRHVSSFYLEQEGGCQKCCISLCSKVFINHSYQMEACPECLNILIYWSKYWVDRLRRTLRRKVKQEYFINRYIDFAAIFYVKLPTSTPVINSINR